MPPPVLAAVGVVSAVLGLFFNGYILLVLVYNRQIRTANNLMLLHLGLADSLFCVQLVLNVVLQEWLDDDPAGIQAPQAASSSRLCVGLGFAWTALLPVIVWSLAGLNCDRYCAIATPLHYSRLIDTRRVFAFVAVSWLVGVSLACPPLFRINPYVYRDSRGGCAADFADPDSGPWYGVVYAWTALFVPTAVMVFCNVRIFLIARFHRHRIVSALYEITLHAQATILRQQRNPFYLANFKGRCAVLTVLQLVGSVVLLYFPYFGLALDELAARRPGNDLLVTVATALVTCSPPTHGFVYGVKSRVLRKTFSNFLRRQLYQSEVHSEIQRQASRRTSLQTSQQQQQQLGRAIAEGGGLPKRLLQRRMSEILNMPKSPRPSSHHRRLSEAPADMLATPNEATLEWLARSIERQESGETSTDEYPRRCPTTTPEEGSPPSPQTLQESNSTSSRAVTPEAFHYHNGSNKVMVMMNNRGGGSTPQHRPLSRQSGGVRFSLDTLNKELTQEK